MSGLPAADGAGIRVLIVDDQALVRAGFRTILASEPGIEVVGDAPDGSAAVELAAQLRPDVICMDVQMPGMDGLEATRRITGDPRSRSAVLMLTTFDREDYLFASLDAGASGFLLKNSPPERLIEAVRVLADGDALLSPEVTRRVILRAATAAADGRDVAQPGATAHGTAQSGTTPGSAALGTMSRRTAQSGTASGTAAPGTGLGPATPGTTAHRTVPPGTASGPAAPGTMRGPGTNASGALAALTEREAEVLELLAQGRSNAEIAGQLFLGEATVKTHVSKVLMKLGVRDRVHAVVYAYEHGIATPGG